MICSHFTITSFHTKATISHYIVIGHTTVISLVNQECFGFISLGTTVIVLSSLQQTAANFLKIYPATPRQCNPIKNNQLYLLTSKKIRICVLDKLGMMYMRWIQMALQLWLSSHNDSSQLSYQLVWQSCFEDLSSDLMSPTLFLHFLFL